MVVRYGERPVVGEGTTPHSQIQDLDQHEAKCAIPGNQPDGELRPQTITSRWSDSGEDEVTDWWETYERRA